MKFSVEVVILPVRDVDRALRFYVDQVGFTLDVDYSPIKPAGPDFPMSPSRASARTVSESIRTASLA
jgi:hypothetical protein